MEMFSNCFHSVGACFHADEPSHDANVHLRQPSPNWADYQDSFDLSKQYTSVPRSSRSKLSNGEKVLADVAGYNTTTTSVVASQPRPRCPPDATRRAHSARQQEPFAGATRHIPSTRQQDTAGNRRSTWFGEGPEVVGRWLDRTKTWLYKTDDEQDRTAPGQGQRSSRWLGEGPEVLGRMLSKTRTWFVADDDKETPSTQHARSSSAWVGRASYAENPAANAPPTRNTRQGRAGRQSTATKRLSSKSRSPSRTRALTRSISQGSRLIRKRRSEPAGRFSPLPPPVAPFRPLQLRIYLPGHELPILPRFSDDEAEADDEIPPVPRIPRPATALMKPKSEMVLGHRAGSFSIPRKPIRYSVSQSQSEHGTTRPRTSSSLHHSRSAHNIGSGIIDLSTRSPLNIPLAEDMITKYRRASDQNHRLQTHLAERAQVDTRSPVLDDHSPPPPPPQAPRSPARSPAPAPGTPSDPDAPTPVIMHAQAVTLMRVSEDTTMHARTSSSGSSTLLNLTASAAGSPDLTRRKEQDEEEVVVGTMDHDMFHDRLLLQSHPHARDCEDGEGEERLSLSSLSSSAPSRAHVPFGMDMGMGMHMGMGLAF